jgi:hypothetical protein
MLRSTDIRHGRAVAGKLRLTGLRSRGVFLLPKQAPELADSIDEKRRPRFEQKSETSASDTAQSFGAGPGCPIHFGPAGESRGFAPGWESRAGSNPRKPATLAHFNDYGETFPFRKAE